MSIEQTAATATPAKEGWVKPEIVSFAPAVEAQSAGTAAPNDGNGTGNNHS